VASDRQVEGPLIFQGEIQQDVSRVDEKHQEKKEDAYGQEHRHKTESANARTEQGKESAGPIEQEQLEPGLSSRLRFMPTISADRPSRRSQRPATRRTSRAVQMTGISEWGETTVDRLGWRSGFLKWLPGIRLANGCYLPTLVMSARPNLRNESGMVVLFADRCK
jgi:hypothetical protein